MLPEANLLSSELADVIRKLDLSHLSAEDVLQLADSSEECCAGLCHGLSFLGNALVSFADKNVLEFSAQSLCQLGHGLSASAMLIPALLQLQKSAELQMSKADCEEG
ncbi:hypothetical protein SOASR030_20290 [Leminorella grimontii]|uniref:Uncharacterized protein n=1 Tax=Leminorella grimontii TaxID=82981 RepID=A0AAV5N5D9_9GAMM|nr:hypothetical protein [Leminorella grimontii]KFC96772.1 hypothetical protein GLGR_0771 [Leminorella grimontii ATCC 33999 = DSM 5078]GKX55917.1 hypothetical protein SOASR030_20290 [Leminorella grimontii]VFS57473.1 Uncharacterised protein [Leminorella grimontii]